MKYTFSSQIWQWPGSASWHFVTLPKDISLEIKQFSEPIKKGFGSVRVQVRIGQSEWNTSIFPDSKTDCYLLPIKKQIRLNESISTGDEVKTSITIDGI